MSDNHGDVTGFAPPGDIHRVHNTAATTAMSIHMYGTDVTRIDSSVRLLRLTTCISLMGRCPSDRISAVSEPSGPDFGNWTLTLCG